MPYNLVQLIERLKKNNFNKKKYEDDLNRSNILIRKKAEFIQSRSELFAQYNLVEFEASDLVFYRITSCQGGCYSIDHGPGTEKTTIEESELSSYLDVEEPVIFYHSGNIDCEINQYLSNIIQKENSLIVIDNIDRVDNAANRRVLLSYIRTSQSLTPAPVIVITSDDIANKLLWEIRVVDGKDSFWNYPSV